MLDADQRPAGINCCSASDRSCQRNTAAAGAATIERVRTGRAASVITMLGELRDPPQEAAKDDGVERQHGVPVGTPEDAPGIEPAV